VDARPVDAAESLIRQQRFVRGVTRSGATLEVNMPLDQVSVLNTALVSTGIEVNALIPRRSLEDYFLSITEGATDIR
jgi:hypothetical protein